MKWWWNRGVEQKANPMLRECWSFLMYIFLHKQRKQCLEFALTKLREICKYLAGACNSNSHARGLHYLTFVCKTKQGKSMQWGERLKKNVSEELSVIYPLWNEEKSLANWIHYICRQKPQPLCEIWIEMGIGEKGMCGHRLIMHSITHRGGDCEKWASLHRLYISQVICKRYDNMQNTWAFWLYLKKEFFT